MPNRYFYKKKCRRKMRRHAIAKSSMDWRPRPGLPSGEECCKQSDPEQFGYPSVLRLLDVYWESETPSTQHRRLRLLRSSKTGDNSERCSSLPERKAHEGERKFIFNLVTTPAFGRGVITESLCHFFVNFQKLFSFFRLATLF